MSEKKIRLDDVMPVIRETLASGHEVTFSPRGTSMLPLLKEGRDSVTLAPPPERLKKFDIPLYQRKNGQYVLHRVVRVGETYTCIGDNQFVFEEGIEHGQVIAVCTAIIRKGKKIYADSALWRLYAIFWHYSRFPRRILLAVAHKVKRLFTKSQEGRK